MLLSKFKDTIKKYNLINKGDRIVIGVSGGPDSVCLLFLLNGLKKEFKAMLIIAHLDHGLRKGSAKDREFVERLGKKLGIKVISSKINVRELSKFGSLEEIFRNARLRFLFRVARSLKAKKIALGHNFDDQAETVLMRILRGSGLNGLSGILPKRNIAGFEIIRPLIEVKRSEIEAYLRRKKIRARIDPSNKQDLFFRNKIRNKLLPLLEKDYNKNVRGVLANMAQSAACDYDYLQQVVMRSMGGQKSRLNLDKLTKLHPAIQRLIIRRAFAGIKGDTRRISFKHIREIEDLILNRPKNSVVDLPKGISVVKKKYLIFYRSSLRIPKG